MDVTETMADMCIVHVPRRQDACQSFLSTPQNWLTVGCRYSHPRKEQNRFVPATANRMQMVEKVTHSDVHGHDSSSLRATTMKEVGSFDGAFVHYLSSGVVSPDEMFLKEERPLLPQTWGFYGDFNEKHFTFVHLMLLNLQGSFPRTTSYRE